MNIAALSPATLLRFLAKIRLDDGSRCWEWTGERANGYGRFWLNRRKHGAHRVSYEHFVGPIPQNMELDHLCGNSGCVSYAHLEPVIHRENVLRGNTIVAKCAVATACPQGHPYTGENLYVAKNGDRHCRTCAKIRGYRRRAQEAHWEWGDPT